MIRRPCPALPSLLSRLVEQTYRKGYCSFYIRTVILECSGNEMIHLRACSDDSILFCWH